MKKRIFGLETEYAIIIAPDVKSSFIPSRYEIFHVLKDVIASHYSVLHSKEVKAGVFMQNGGRFHHEACLNALLEGVLECSTPECSNCRDVAVYGKASDEILEEMRQELEGKFREKGFKGSIFFGKNSRDSKGNFYGTHENYLVDDPVTGSKKIFLFLTVFFFFSIFLIMIIIFNLPVLLFMLIISLLFVLLCIINLPLTFLGIRLKIIRKLGESILDILKTMVSPMPSLFTRIFGEIFRFSTILWAYSCGFFLRQTVFTEFNKYLTPYLLTRVIFTGSGRLLDKLPANETRRIPFELSQKAEAIKTVCTIFWDDYYKPVFSLKNFIKSPRSVFKREKRLHLMYCDSNMNEFVTYINTGITGLIIRMIEEGHPFKDLTPKDTIRALREFSLDLTMKKKIPLKNGTSMSSLDIQRYYLEESKKFYLPSEDLSDETKKLLKLWENILNSLEINPHLLYKELDWVAKKDLMNEVLRGMEDISFSSRVLKWFKIFRDKFQEECTIMDEEELLTAVKEKLSFLEKRTFKSFLKHEGITCRKFMEKFLIYCQLQKIDLKYHELNKDSGYYYKLLNSGLIRRVACDEDIKNAKLNPPSDTRAGIRGNLVKFLVANSLSAMIGWDDVLISDHGKHIYFPEPFQKELDEKDRNYIDSLKKNISHDNGSE
ncbi:MAG: proteasome accessory factor PafA2 family protein [Candidatus Eremiobacterota bacterium]